MDGNFWPGKSACEKTAKRNEPEPIENKRFGEMAESGALIVSRTCFARCETIRFVWRNEPLRFAPFLAFPALETKRRAGMSLAEQAPQGRPRASLGSRRRPRREVFGGRAKDREKFRRRPRFTGGSSAAGLRASPPFPLKPRTSPPGPRAPQTPPDRRR